MEAVKALVATFALTAVIVDTFGVDGCVTALGVFTTYILSNWPLAKLGRDNWHKMKEWGPAFESFCSQNTAPYARDKLCPRIYELFEAGKLVAYKSKSNSFTVPITARGKLTSFEPCFWVWLIIMLTNLISPLTR